LALGRCGRLVDGVIWGLRLSSLECAEDNGNSNRGSFDCADHDEAVIRFAQDDNFLGGEGICFLGRKRVCRTSGASGAFRMGG
jgi:hypothetical protein